MTRFRKALLTFLFLTFVTSCAFANHDLPPCESGFKAYPNLANITDEERALFHPVMKFPKHSIPVLDCTQATGLASEQQIKRSKIRGQLFGFLWKKVVINLAESKLARKLQWKTSKWGFGKYDEDRKLMYTSSVFDEENVVDGYAGARTVHLGIDLGAPVGAKVRENRKQHYSSI
mmetsp:Transcript_1711/g.3709  ORF Transcript_1711/g.3709 Transcript_1711/m.3709 type:complete len:175 (-) Transcript_1711:1296-1820(-)